MDVVSVRYIVDDVAGAVDFYTSHLGFETQMDAAPHFAALTRGPLRLLLNSTAGKGGASQAMPDGQRPAPGGWNRIQLTTPNLATVVEKLTAAGLRFRNDLVQGQGGAQILLEDPSGNLVELFEPAATDPPD